MPIETNRVLVKMRPSSALKAAESRANLTPLYDSVQMTSAFGAAATPQWFIAEMPEGAGSPWDVAHGRVADQLGVAASDVLFAEPDMIHDVYVDVNEERTEEGFGATKIECAWGGGRPSLFGIFGGRPSLLALRPRLVVEGPVSRRFRP